MKQYQWKVLPQGMKNSPTRCQKFVVQALAPVRLKYPKAYIIHYMDDILLSAPKEQVFHFVLDTKVYLNEKGLMIAPGKIQKTPPFQYLGTLTEGCTVWPQKMQIWISESLIK